MFIGTLHDTIKRVFDTCVCKKQSVAFTISPLGDVDMLFVYVDECCQLDLIRLL